MWSRVLLVVVLLWSGYGAWAAREPQQIDNRVQSAPIQTALTGPIKIIEKAGFDLTPVANIDIEARVLGREIYRFDSVAALAPVDLALGWGAMSDSEVLKSIHLRQGERFLYWSTDHFPVPREVIETSATNAHMIPATPEIEAQLRAIRPGEVVRFSGTLVNAYRPTDGRSWKTSLSRSDTGDGACEIVYVTHLDVFQPAD
jgi:hypothetical protein